MELNPNVTIILIEEQITKVVTTEMIINGETITIKVPIFMPQNDDDIVNGVNNRYISESVDISGG